MPTEKRFNRYAVRELIFKLLFIAEFKNEQEMEEQLKELYIPEVASCVFLDGAAVPTEEELTAAIERFKLAISYRAKADEILSEYSEGWKVSRMSKVDLCILRLAVFEMLFDEDMPVGVAINEAVALAKKYGGESSQSFVNGVLGKISRGKRN